ncbi:hypothetical protein [Afipia sp. DC4300-2b1]
MHSSRNFPLKYSQLPFYAPYRNSGQAMTDLLGGQFDYYMCDAVTALP